MTSQDRAIAADDSDAELAVMDLLLQNAPIAELCRIAQPETVFRMIHRFPVFEPKLAELTRFIAHAATPSPIPPTPPQLLPHALTTARGAPYSDVDLGRTTCAATPTMPAFSVPVARKRKLSESTDSLVETVVSDAGSSHANNSKPAETLRLLELQVAKMDTELAQVTFSVDKQRVDVASLKATFDAARERYDAAHQLLADFLRSAEALSFRRLNILRSMVTIKQAADDQERTKRMKLEEKLKLQTKYRDLLYERFQLLKTTQHPISARIISFLGTLCTKSRISQNIRTPGSLEITEKQDSDALCNSSRTLLNQISTSKSPCKNDLSGPSPKTSKITYKYFEFIDGQWILSNDMLSLVDICGKYNIQDSRISLIFESCSAGNDGIGPSTLNQTTISPDLALSLTSGFDANFDFIPAMLQPNRKTLDTICLCRFECAGGTCNDPSCSEVHFNELGTTEGTLKQVRDTWKKAADPYGFISSLKAGLVNCANEEQILQTVANCASHAPIALELPTLPKSFGTKHPVLIEGLSKILDGTFEKQIGRYYEKPMNDSDYEELLLKSPSGSDFWLQYAISCLPSDLTHAKLSGKSCHSLRVLSILQRALLVNPTVKDFWELYLEILIRKETPDGIRSASLSALEFLPTCWTVWWRLIFWESDKQLKLEYLFQMLEKAISNALENGKETSNSAIILDIVVNICHCAIAVHGVAKTKSFLASLLMDACNDREVMQFLASRFDSQAKTKKLRSDYNLVRTIGFKHLSSRDLAIFWTIYLHFELHGSLPASSDLFYSSPHTFVVRKQIICVLADPSETPHDEFCAIFKWLLLSWPQDRQTRCIHYKALCRTHFEIFGMAFLKLGATIPASLHLHAGSLKISSQTRDPIFCNMKAKIANTRRDLGKVISCLVNSIRAGFSDCPPIETCIASDVQFALQLYRSALRIGPEFRSSRLPTPQLEGPYDVCPTFTWINYMILSILSNVGAGFTALLKPFDLALQDQPGNNWIRKEYLKFYKGKLSSDQIYNILGGATTHHANPYCDQSVHRFNQQMPIADSRFETWLLNEILADAKSAVSLPLLETLASYSVHEYVILCASKRLHEISGKNGQSVVTGALRALKIGYRDKKLWKEVLELPWTESARAQLEKRFELEF